MFSLNFLFGVFLWLLEAPEQALADALAQADTKWLLLQAEASQPRRNDSPRWQLLQQRSNCLQVDGGNVDGGCLNLLTFPLCLEKIGEYWWHLDAHHLHRRCCRKGIHRLYLNTAKCCLGSRTLVAEWKTWQMMEIIWEYMR